MCRHAVVALMGSSLVFHGWLPGQGAPTPGSVTRLPGWNIEFSLPVGWRIAQEQGRVRMLASTSEPGMIFIAPGLYENADEMIADLTRLYASMNQMPTPVEMPASALIGGLPAMVATYDSQDQTLRPVRARYVNVLTPHGTGLNLLAMSAPEHFDRLRVTVERLAASVIAATPDPENGAMAALAGTWRRAPEERATTSAERSPLSAEESVTFDGHGGYRWRSFSFMSQYGRLSGSATASTVTTAAGQVDVGSYAVLGNRLVLRGSRGQFALEFELEGDRLVIGGKRYERQ
jgi:hypothetical protein